MSAAWNGHAEIVRALLFDPVTDVNLQADVRIIVFISSFLG
jgi:hypothetical protein